MKKLNITPGPWEFLPVYHEGTIMTAYIRSENYSIGKVAPNNELNNEIANAEAICKAVNNTYHKGINPEAVEIMRDALIWARKMIELYSKELGEGHDLNPIKSETNIVNLALKKAGVNIEEGS